MGCFGSKQSGGQSSAPKSKSVKQASRPGGGSQSNVNVTAATFVKEQNKKVHDIYKISTTLGQGGFGCVKKVVHKKNGEARAMKIINKHSLMQEKDEESKLLREIEILKELDHPGIIKIYEFLQDSKNYYLITELCTGGELFDKIVSYGSFNEGMAADIMFQVLSVINYCHSNQIVHRDLKPENLLLVNKDSKSPIKVIDFGTSRKFDPNTKMRQRLGTPYYIAPEVLKGQYDEKCDIWSLGVIMYIMLCGYPPFNANDDDKILRKIERGKYSYDGPEWRQVSESAKDLIDKMLTKDPADRWSASQCLEHKWIKSRASPDFIDAPVSKSAMDNLKNFGTQNKLRQATMVFISTQLTTKEEREELERTFRSLDKNNDGTISREEIIQGFREIYGAQFDEDEIGKIMVKLDSDGSGTLDYTEFTIAAISYQQILTEERLKQAFEAFDLDGNKQIDYNELKQILGGSEAYEDQVWKDMIAEVDKNGDGVIDFNEFKGMMSKHV